MSFADHLDPQAVLFAPPVQDKWGLIRAMVDSLVAAGLLPAERAAAARTAVEARERSVSTGMEHGIAVPHAALDDLPRLLAAVAVLPQGVDFDSLDGRSAQIVVLLVVPRREKVLHVRTLTEVARKLGDPLFRQQVLAAQSAAELVELWR